MTGLSTTSPVDTILDKESFTLEELLDEDEIIQECKALNTRLINFLRDKAQVEKLLRYIVEEFPEDGERKESFKFPFIACEIFTCEIDMILRTLVEDEELMNLLFSFLKPDHEHGTLLSGYFSKVVLCLMVRKSNSLMTYIQSHREIIAQLVDLIGITSIMEVLLRLIGADETMYTVSSDSTKWLENTNVLELIVKKFSSSESPEVHANASEILSAITRYAPPSLASNIDLQFARQIKEIEGPLQQSQDIISKPDEFYAQSSTNNRPSLVSKLKKLMFRRVLIGVNDGRFFLGSFHCIDKQGNIILQDAVEYRTARRSVPAKMDQRCLGLILIPASCRSSCHVDCAADEQMSLLSLDK